MTRAVRTARGAAGAAIATLFAAVSHGLAGGVITPLAVVATAVIALPICVALAGRTGSLWRLALGVSVSQFLYHWTFSGLGIASGAGSTPAAEQLAALGPHAAHLGAMPFAPALVASGAADAWMWAAHALAAALTVALVHRGERAAIHLLSLVRSALVPAFRFGNAGVRVGRSGRPAAAPILHVLPTLRERLTVLSAISHRGPPAAPAAITCR